MELLFASQDEEDSERLLHEFQRMIGIIILLAEPLPINAVAEKLKNSFCGLDSDNEVKAENHLQIT
jgi:hypothetical protein